MSEKLIAENALSCVEAVIEKFKNDKDVLGSFRNRAREFSTEQFTKGLHYVFVLIAARAGRDSIEQGLKGSSCKDVINSIDVQRLGPEKEKAGYALYGASLAFLINKYIESIGMKRIENFNDLIKQCFENKILITRAHVLLEWVKRLAEAYIPGGRASW